MPMRPQQQPWRGAERVSPCPVDGCPRARARSARVCSEVSSVNEQTKQGPERAARASDPLDTVMRYHQETKHHFSRYARSLGYLDWANQPDPFRRYEGTSLFALPRLKPEDAPVSPLYEDLYRAGAIQSAPLGVRSLSRLFEYSLAISAWKQAGEVRWALR